MILSSKSLICSMAFTLLFIGSRFVFHLDNYIVYFLSVPFYIVSSSLFGDVHFYRHSYSLAALSPFELRSSRLMSSFYLSVPLVVSMIGIVVFRACTVCEAGCPLRLGAVTALSVGLLPRFGVVELKIVLHWISAPVSPGGCGGVNGAIFTFGLGSAAVQLCRALFLLITWFYSRSSASFQLVCCGNCSTYRSYFSVFMGRGEIHIFLLYHLIPFSALQFWNVSFRSGLYKVDHWRKHSEHNKNREGEPGGKTKEETSSIFFFQDGVDDQTDCVSFRGPINSTPLTPGASLVAQW